MVLKFTGSAFFRQRIVLATLAGKTVVIREIRANEERPGITEYEASLLRLMEKMTNGSRIEIDVTGTTVYYKPGLIVGGIIEHDCGTDRGIGYFLEALISLAPFGKAPLQASLTGITNHNDNLDVTADLFRVVLLPNLRHFGISDGLLFKIVKRGAPPTGGGFVQFTCPVVKALQSIQLVDEGRVRRIRGLAFSTRVAPSTPLRAIDTAKAALVPYIGDVYIYADHYKGKESGSSSGYGMTLVAETDTGCFLSAELVAKARELPEDIGKQAANQLLVEILRRGCVDSVSQSVMMLLMALGPEDVSRLRVGKLTPYSIEFLRNIKEFFGVTFKIEADEDTTTILLTCMGCGYLNLSRRVM